jgi:hypothetical protein
MTPPLANDWTTGNQRYLTAALAGVGALLARHAGREVPAPPPDSCEAIAARMPAPPTLTVLAERFGLSRFEQDVVLLCAGIELEGAFAERCAAAGAAAGGQPTFSLALAALREPHWSALAPSRPLRWWRLLELGPGPALTTSPLRIDERILHFLAGVDHLDERLVGLLDPVARAGDPVPSHAALVDRVERAWADAGSALPILQLVGPDVAARAAVAATACTRLGLGLYRLPAALLPGGPGELDSVIRLWTREAVLAHRAVLLEDDGGEPGVDVGRDRAMAIFLARVGGPVIVSGRGRRPPARRAVVTLEVTAPSPSEQRALWSDALGPCAAALDGEADRLVGQFDLGASAIRRASAEALGAARGEVAALAGCLWDACRAQARPRLDDLAQRIVPVATWDDLVLPEPQRLALRDLAAHVRQRHRVYEDWGFAARGGRGLGVSALFAGPSGTGKTMAAEVLAGELRLDCYRIDLSQVVSKYIGETEKNLRRVFDAAEAGGAILLFDEADALFGKRSEVKDSHDRYANIEVSYLLQRMEAYRGLAILTTNAREALDPAFLRRLRFVVQFAFPDAAQRAEIWRRVFPPATPTDGLRPERLARLAVPGGNIRNIALYAAFLAADACEPVRMGHLLRAARAESAKLDRPLSEAEIGGWE